MSSYFLSKVAQEKIDTFMAETTQTQLARAVKTQQARPGEILTRVLIRFLKAMLVAVADRCQSRVELQSRTIHW